jgi:thiamine-monophosphate kinase
VGDLIGVTGVLGESAYGLSLLKKGMSGRGLERCISRYRNPKPPYPVWKELVKRDITHAMMDISDGLIIDLERMMTESRKGARINLAQVPMPAIPREEKPEDFALAGGEDYQFLFTFPTSKLRDVYDITRSGFPISIIGEVVRGRGVRVFQAGKEMKVTAKGYEHFGDTH